MPRSIVLHTVGISGRFLEGVGEGLERFAASRAGPLPEELSRCVRLTGGEREQCLRQLVEQYFGGADIDTAPKVVR